LIRNDNPCPRLHALVLPFMVVPVPARPAVVERSPAIGIGSGSRSATNERFILEEIGEPVHRIVA
jgi:hypothetical protein